MTSTDWTRSSKRRYQSPGNSDAINSNGHDLGEGDLPEHVHDISGELATTRGRNMPPIHVVRKLHIATPVPPLSECVLKAGDERTPHHIEDGKTMTVTAKWVGSRCFVKRFGSVGVWDHERHPVLLIYGLNSRPCRHQPRWKTTTRHDPLADHHELPQTWKGHP